MSEPIRPRPEWLPHIKRLVDQAPPLTVEQIDKLAILLRQPPSESGTRARTREGAA